MCLVLLDWQPKQDNWLNLVSNRDEFFARPTLPLQKWQTNSNLYAGIDVAQAGTWLGVNTALARFAVLTNVRAKNSQKQGRSRGHLVRDILSSPDDIAAFSQQIIMEEYASFNLLVGNQQELFYLSNYPTPTIQPLKAGIYTLSNASLNTPWAKALAAKKQYQKWQQSADKDLLYLLDERQVYPLEQLPDTGVPTALEQQLSAQFIQLPNYGTVSSHSLIAQQNQLSMHEVQWDKKGLEIRRTCLSLTLY